MIEKSKAQLLAELPRDEQIRIINEIAPTDWDKRLLLTSWRFIARPSQIEPFDKDYKCLLLLTARGFGKSITLSNWVIHKARKHKGAIIGVAGASVNDTNKVIVDYSPTSIMKQAPIDFQPVFVPTQKKILFPNGSVVFTFTSDDADSTRGFNFDFFAIDEIIRFNRAQEFVDNMLLALRRGNHPQWICATTPKPFKYLRELVNQKDTLTIRGKTSDNRMNLPQSYLDTLEEKYKGTRLYAQEVEGTLLADIEGALWSWKDIENSRLSPKDVPNEFDKIVISIDPAVTSKRKSDLTGLTVVGAYKNNYYLLKDESDKYSPSELATKVYSLSSQYNTNIVLYESNQGHDYIKAVIELVGDFKNKTELKLIDVFANKSKFKRAEAIYGLYEQKKVFHVGVFTELENELLTYTDSSNFSPDRLDSLVHALTHLSVTKKIEHKTTQNGLW